VNVLVMGSGAVGGYYGAVLRHAGNDVTFVARGDHLAAIRERGLRVDSVTSGNFTVTADATDRPDASVRPDLVLLCVKGYDNAAAIELLRPVVGESTTVLTLQNGIGSGAQLSDAFGQDRVMLGVTYVDAALRGPGHVAEFGGPSRLVFGEADGRETDRAAAVRDAFSGAGVTVELTSDVETALWRKFLFICAWSGMICVTRSPMSQILALPGTERLTAEVLREVQSVAGARGIELPDSEVEAAMQSFRDAGEDSVSSMFIDLQAGKPLEIEVLNAAVARMGAEVGVATPVNDFISACLALPHRSALAARAGGS
jgi:2-dehydropantoate 2-reductase